MPETTVNLLDYTIFNDSLERCIEEVIELSKTSKFSRVVTINPQMIVGGERNLILKKWLRSADLIVPDGVGVNIASRILAKQSLSVTTGVQLVQHLLGKNKYRFYFVGAGPKQIEDAVDICKNLCPGSDIVGYSHGFLSVDEQETLIQDIVAKEPDFIFVGLGFPKQEYFIQSLSFRLKRGVAIGVGGVFDIISGHKRLAPTFMRRFGLEWVFRGVQEPKRVLTWSFLIRYVFIVLQSCVSQKAK